MWVYAGPARTAAGLAAVVAVIGLVFSTRRWMRMTAVAIPVLMLIGMFAVTPSALGQKLEVQFDSTPQCVGKGSDEPMATAGRESQRASDSISHIGDFSGGGVSGVGGCERRFVLSGDVDVLRHYRAALPAAGWDIAEDDGRRLRAQRDGPAFEVMPCSVGGVVWAGSDDGLANGIQMGCGQHWNFPPRALKTTFSGGQVGETPPPKMRSATLTTC